MINNAELRASARRDLGHSLFHNDWLTGLALCFVGGLIASAFPLILVGPVNCGLATAFLRKARHGGKFLFDDLFVGFDDFGSNLLLGLMQALIPFLWGLIPIAGIYFGIRKYYSYALAFYIRADSPMSDWRECLDRSAGMMEGHRWELFCLQLSFLGWALLGCLACGLGVLWVSPYQQAAETHFYEELRRYGA